MRQGINVHAHGEAVRGVVMEEHQSLLDRVISGRKFRIKIDKDGGRFLGDLIARSDPATGGLSMAIGGSWAIALTQVVKKGILPDGVKAGTKVIFQPIIVNKERVIANEIVIDKGQNLEDFGKRPVGGYIEPDAAKGKTSHQINRMALKLARKMSDGFRPYAHYSTSERVIENLKRRLTGRPTIQADMRMMVDAIKSAPDAVVVRRVDGGMRARILRGSRGLRKLEGQKL